MHRAKSKGHSLIEMTCAILVIIPIFLALIDLYFLIIGYWWGISNCRLAARVASQGPPDVLSKDAPKHRVLGFLTSAGADDKTIRLEDCQVSEKIKSLPDPKFGGAVNGTVSVAITIDVTPPFLLKYAIPGHKFTVSTSETSPYTWIQNASKKKLL